MILRIEDLEKIVKLCGSVSAYAGYVARDLRDNYINEGLLPLPKDIEAFKREIRGCIALLEEASAKLNGFEVLTPYAAVLEPVMVAVEVEA